MFRQLLEPAWVLHLTDVLLYHVASGNVTSSDLMDGMVVTMVNEENITVGIDGSTVTINESAMVVAVDVFADNGVAHVINAVLTPSFLSATIVDIAQSSATTLAALVVRAELQDVLGADDGTFTVCTQYHADKML